MSRKGKKGDSRRCEVRQESTSGRVELWSKERDERGRKRGPEVVERRSRRVKRKVKHKERRRSMRKK